MESAAASASAPLPGVFEDGLGKRRHVSDPAGGGMLEVLCLRDELTAVPAFEFALRERTGRLAAFRQPTFGPVRSIDRLAIPASSLAVVSEYTAGVRLSTLLSTPERRRLDLNASLHLVRQLVSAAALLHEHEPGIAHGAIGPERTVVTPNARLVVVEYVLGGAIEQLCYSRERYWSELRIATPSSPDEPQFDQRTDVMQVGLTALALVIGRLIDANEYLSTLPDLVATARALSKGEEQPLPPGLRAWLLRSLQLDPATAFASASEAAADFERMVQDDAAYALQCDEHSARGQRPRSAASAPASPAPVLDSTPAVAPVSAPRGIDVQAVHDDGVETELESAAWNSADESIAEPSPGILATIKRFSPKAIGAVAAVCLVVVAGSIGARRYFAPAALAAATGTVNVTTNPAGAQVYIDGRARGVSPLSVALNPGPHSLELRGGSGGPRTMTFTVVAGAVVAQYIDMPAETPPTGQLQIRTEPAGAQVAVDEVSRGVSPVTVDGLGVGDHVVAVTSAAGTIKQHVTIAAGATAAVVVPLAADPAAASGWVSVSAPAQVQLYENKKLLGTSESDRIVVSAGRHQIDIVNETLGYRETKTVTVPSGKVTPIRLDWPKGTIALNAVPWAEVWVDGEKAGETPIGNLSVAVGAHEVVFRHPELGEQRHAVSVTVGTPVRLSVDMRKK